MRGSAVFRTGVAPGGVLAGPWVKNELWRRARAVPSLDLRFADNKSLVDAVTGQSLVTFTRASSGTYVGSDGLIKTATTNALLRSEEFDNASWTLTEATVTANSIASPTGSISADLLVESNQNAAHYVQSSALVAASGTAYTFSCYAKAGTRSRIELLGFALGLTGRGFDLSNGTTFANTAGFSEPSSFSITPVGSGWYRCSITANGNGLTSTVRVYLNNGTSYAYQGNGTSGIYLWGAQLEAGAFPTSYIPTTTATVTRSADVASISGSNFSGWYRQDEGTVFAEGSSFDARTNDGIFLAVFDDNSISNEININRRIASYLASFAITTAGVTQADIFGSAWQTGSIGRCAGAFKANDAATSFNGGTVATDAAVTVPTVNTLRFGRRANGFNVWNGTIRRLVYWGQRLPNSVLQTITQ